ncbi:MAG: hypothetical protein M3483_05125 [Gemmatimonadota bacterium]|nr:hypothetical protein [Gemmatimonadota bacterium]
MVEPPNIQQFVAGNAAAALGPDGRFALAAPTAPTDVPIITAERAGDLALSTLRTYGTFLEPSWERMRGTDIDLSSVVMEPRIFYAETPYELFPEGAHPAYRRGAGPMYLVYFSSGGERVLTVGVSAYNTDLGIDSTGAPDVPFYSGNDFMPLGVSPNTATGWGFVPVSPEEAVAEVAARTGARVAEPPRLVLRGIHHPVEAQWEITLDRPVRARAGGRAPQFTRKLYVGPGLALRVPQAVQPSVRHFPQTRAAGLDGGLVPMVLAASRSSSRRCRIAAAMDQRPSATRSTEPSHPACSSTAPDACRPSQIPSSGIRNSNTPNTATMRRRRSACPSAPSASAAARLLAPMTPPRPRRRAKSGIALSAARR